MKVAAVHMNTIHGKIDKNIEELQRAVHLLEKEDVQFALFPELNISGYIRDKKVLDELLIKKDYVLKELEHISATSGISFAAGFPEMINSNFYIAQHLFSNGKHTGTQRKTHLSPNEQNIYTESNDLKTFMTEELNIGMQLCFESHMPEISYYQASKGANILCMAYASPKETGNTKMNRFMRFLSARAYDNACYVIACNMASTDGSGTYFPGVSLAFDPKGNLLSHSYGDHTDFCIAKVEPEETERIKNAQMAWFNKFKRKELMRKIYNY